MASGRNWGRLTAVDLTNQYFLWASVVWGAIASGYVLYGWRQKSAIPLVGGVAMTAASIFLPAFWMSLASLAIMFAVWWLLRQGY